MRIEIFDFYPKTHEIARYLWNKLITSTYTSDKIQTFIVIENILYIHIEHVN